MVLFCVHVSWKVINSHLIKFCCLAFLHIKFMVSDLTDAIVQMKVKCIVIFNVGCF